MLRRVAALLVLFLALAGCGGSEDGGTPGDTASLWVTRDRGGEVVLTATVPAGATAIQALDREADVETRYGGRFVQVVNGIEGDLGKQQDWFYFVNGIEPGIGGAEVKLRPGDVVWWDYRDWGERMEQPVVVGAFPEPFRHGWQGRRRPAEVRAPAGLGEEADALQKLLGGGGSGRPNVFMLVVKDGAAGATLEAGRGATDGSPVTFTLSGSLSAVRASARALVRDPAVVRYRYVARFDERGEVVE